MIRFTPGAEPHTDCWGAWPTMPAASRPAGFRAFGSAIRWAVGGRRSIPSIELAVLAAVTERVELGIGVLQVPLRHPIELAHRVQSVQALSGGRLRLGVGSGSTRADFELLGGDYDHRFRTFGIRLRTMRQVWRGEPVNGGTLSIWPGCEGGPPILMGAWRSPRWITSPPRNTRAGRRPAATAAGTISKPACASIAKRAAPMRCSPMSRSISPTGPESAEPRRGHQCGAGLPARRGAPAD